MTMNVKDIKTIDADGHVTETFDLWDNYIEPKYREFCPKLTVRDDGTETWRMDEQRVYNGIVRRHKPSISTSATFGARTGVRADDALYHQAEKGGFTPHDRIEWMDKEGFDGTVLFPTMAMMAIHEAGDPAYQIAVTRAYNRWLVDFCAPYKDRLFGAAGIPMLTVEGAIEEVRWAKKAGFNAGFVRPNPIGGRALHDPDFYPLWEECAELDFAIGVHGSAATENLGVDRFSCGEWDVGHSGQGTRDFKSINKLDIFAVEHSFVHTAEMMAAVTSFVLAGVCDLYPKLRVAFVEAGGGWAPGYVDRMDRHFDDQGMNDLKIKTRPSEIFERQCYMGFEPIEDSVKVLLSHYGGTKYKFMMSTDYPHSDGFPDTVKTLREWNLEPATEARVFADNFKEWYGLH